MIEDAVNKIYKTQFEKHKLFINSVSNGINYLFKESGEITLKNMKIAYLAVDKRCQLHKDDQHLISIYVLLFLITKIQLLIA